VTEEKINLQIAFVFNSHIQPCFSSWLLKIKQTVFARLQKLVVDVPLVNKPKIFDMPKCLALMKELLQNYTYGDPRFELMAGNCTTVYSRGQKFKTTLI